MNFIEIFRKYDKVVESFIGKTKSKTTRDIIGDADRYVSKDKEILHQLKEFVEQDGHEKYFGFSEDLPGQFYIEQQNDEGELEEWVIIELNLITSVEDGNMDVNLGEEGSYVEAFAVNKDYSYYVTVRWEELDIDTRNGILDYLNFTDLRYDQINESFTRKISRKKNDELISKSDTAFLPDGVYILHKTLGVRTVGGWNPKDNKGVVGILLIEDDHKIVVALEDAPEKLRWSKKPQSVNEPIGNYNLVQSDFNGEYYCQNLNSPDFPAAYYCLNYKKGNRSWYLPSAGELLMIYNHLEEIQSALEVVGGQKIVTDDDVREYLSSTEYSGSAVWFLHFVYGISIFNKDGIYRVRPVSAFHSSLKESFTRKIRSKKNDELTSKADTAFVPDGVYILHETLGVNGVEGWNPKNNNGVVGILLVEDDHKIVVATEDAPKDLQWSKDYKLVNRPADSWKDAESDFNGEEYCRNLNSPDFPAAYYCLNYNKGGRDWYLPSMGELWLIYRHLEEVQTALSIVGGQRFVTEWDDNDDNDENAPWYWSSTEYSAKFYTWVLLLDDRDFSYGGNKVDAAYKVRPVSKFDSSLKESFTRKTKKQTSTNVLDNADEDIKMKSPLTFEDDEVSNIFFNELVDVDDYEDNVYTLEDASIDSHEHDGYSEYFPFDDYQSNSWKDNDKIVKFNELRFFTGLKKLPEYAFVNCTSLEELILPDNLEQIEQGAFANCISLKTVKMPKNRTLKFIEDSAFANTGLVSVVIPDGVKVIGECAFADCEYLESVVIPPSVKKIERGAFSRCRKLKSVSGIETVSEFGTDVFYGCGLLERLDSDVFGKFLIPRRFDKTLFSADWIYDSNTVEERFLETYCLNHYDTEDYKHITEKEWEEDEFNPNSPNFDDNQFSERAWDYACDDVSWDWDDFKQLINNKFQGRGGWVCLEDGERFSDFSSAFEYCIPDNCDWGELEVKQDGGSLIVCGTEIVPLCDRYIDDEIDEIYPNEFIDYESLRFCDPIEKEISL